MRRLGLGAAAAAVVAALLVPGHRVGVGLTVAALTVAAAAWRGRSATSDSGDGPLDAALDRAPAALALVLCLTAALRDAGWVVAISAAGAVALGSLAAAGGRTWPAVMRGLVAGPRGVPAGAVAVAEGVGALMPPARVGEVRPVARGAAVAVVLAGAFGALFASADAAFAQIAGDVLTPGWDVGSLSARAACAAAAALATGALAVAAARPLAPDGVARVPRLGRTEWAIALGVLDALFVAFVAVQLTVMFGGADHVLQTAGLTYAEYAREGFAQLLVVAALTLAVTALAGPVAPRALTGLLLALTLVVVASALHRLGLYQQAFGFTRLRLGADAIGLWLGALLVVVLVAGASAAARQRLPRVAVAVAALVLVAFVAINPDGYIAARNVDRQARTGRLDLAYARSLSADAAGALARLPAPLAACALAPLRDRLARERDGIGGANLARARARRVLRRAPSRCSP